MLLPLLGAFWACSEGSDPNDADPTEAGAPGDEGDPDGLPAGAGGNESPSAVAGGGGADTGAVGGAGAGETLGGAGGVGGAGDQCHLLPLLIGCGDEAEYDEICLPEPFELTTASCGVRLSDGATVWSDAPFETMECYVANPFHDTPGFRVCTQEEADASQCKPAPPVATPRNVEFVITNSSGISVWLRRSGSLCGAVTIYDAVTDLRLPRVASSACYATCAHGDDTDVRTHAQLADGESAAITWDALTAELRAEVNVCPDDSDLDWCPPGTDTRCLRALPKNAAPGAYVATFSYDKVPSDEYGDVVSVGPLLESCIVDWTVSVTFELPVSGDLVVPVTIE